MMSEMSNATIPIPSNQAQLQTTLLSSSISPGAGFASQAGGTTLSYPSDTPKYMMTFTISQYTRSDLTTVGTFQPANYPGIVLPLPSQLVDVNSVNWAEVEIGTLAGTAVNGIAAATQGNMAGAVGNGLVAGAAGLLSAIGQGGASTAAGAVIGQVAAGAAQGFKAIAGISPNQFVTLLMKGPKYKRHQFNWTLSPFNAAEADTIRQITNVFKNAMSPNIYTATQGSTTPILWAFPKIFYIRLYPNSKFLYKFKPAVCDNFVVNYTPGGRGAFYRDTAVANGLDGNNPPESVQIQASFIELEYWIEGNFTDDNSPDSYSSNTPTTISSELTNVYNKVTSALGSVSSSLTNTFPVQ